MGSQGRIGLQEEAAVNRNRDIPADHRAGQYDDADIEADDVADPKQGGRQVRTHVGDRLAHPGRTRCGIREEAQTTGRTHLGEGAEQRRDTENFQALARVLAGFQNFCRRLAFRKCEALVDDQRAAQRHRKDHAQQAAEPRNCKHPLILELFPVTEDHQGGNREDHAGSNRRAR